MNIKTIALYCYLFIFFNITASSTEKSVSYCERCLQCFGVITQADDPSDYQKYTDKGYEVVPVNSSQHQPPPTGNVTAADPKKRPDKLTRKQSCVVGSNLNLDGDAL